MLKWLLTLCIALLVLGLVSPWLRRAGFGRLPGDVQLRRRGKIFNFPFTSTILLSLALTLLMRLFGH